MNSPLEPRIPDNYYPSLYIPVYSLDDGITWVGLQPCSSSTEAKNRLKSWMPDPYRLESDARFDGLRVGCVGFRIQDINNKFSFEFIPADFAKD